MKPETTLNTGLVVGPLLAIGLGLLHLLAGPSGAAERAAVAPQNREPEKRQPAPAQPAPGSRPKVTGHWGEETIGFRWEESDSVDDRWKYMDNGPFLSHSLAYPGGMAERGIAIRLGENQAAALFDATHCGMVYAWKGDFLKFDGRRFGFIQPPVPAGEAVCQLENVKPWGQATVYYQGLYRHGPRLALAYSLGTTQILESPAWEGSGEAGALRRTFSLSAFETALRLNVLTVPGTAALVERQGLRFALWEHQGTTLAVALVNEASPREAKAELFATENRVELLFPASAKNASYAVYVWRGKTESLHQFVALVKQAVPEPLAKFKEAGPKLWGEPLVTRGVLGSGAGPYVVDTLTLPEKNPWRALLFAGGHDFFANGNAAVCTTHGDVWLVGGIDDQLEKLTWQRFATGLYQPLGLRIVADKIYVLGRDRITRLHDTNGDGEADFYENFNSTSPTSPGGHDYAAGLETDSQGNFYYVRAHQGLVKVTPDGSRSEVVATGFRNPNGLGVGPGDVITVAPQEGEWTPGSKIDEIRPGGHYGFGGPRVAPERPLGYDPPLVWLPRIVDNSTGGQCWVTSGRWGPLENQMLSFSFGRCWPLLILRDTSAQVPQGAAVNMGLTFDSGAMRGRFAPQDGQLYVTGLKGWASSAVRDGCFQRVRYTGGKVYLPTRYQVVANGVVIGFAEPLERAAAEEPGNYAVEQWQYRYGSHYGSPDYKVSDPAAPGRDTVEVRSATLLDDGRSVFLELGPMKPVMQVSIRLDLHAADGAAIRHTISATVNAVPETSLTPRAPSETPAPLALPPATVARLQPGVVARFEQRPGETLLRDCRVQRLAALSVPARTSPAMRLKPLEPGDTLTVRWQGFLFVPLAGNYTFAAGGPGEASLEVNGNRVAPAAAPPPGARAGEPAAAPSLVAFSPVRLQKGHNALSVALTLDAKTAALGARLLWKGDDFDWEPVPATVLFHDPADEELVSSERLRAGRDLFGTNSCAQCHAVPDEVRQSRYRMPELEVELPVLLEAGWRFRKEWLYYWILDPHTLRPEARMPRLLRTGNEAAQQQQAADLAAYLATVKTKEVLPLEFTAAEGEEGEKLFENLGCIACHRFTPATEKDRWQRLSLNTCGDKFTPAALVEYLRSPQWHYAGSRMPNFQLSAIEARVLAAYLQREAPARLATPEAFAAASAERGRQLYAQVGCKQCHVVGPPPDATRRPWPEQPAGLAGCLADEPPAAAPLFHFTRTQRENLAEFVARSLPGLANDPPAEFAARAQVQFRCTACHALDESNPSWPRILGEEGSQGTPPEIAPSLNHVGEKLRGDYVRRLLGGEPVPPARPWLKARMPAWGFGAEPLAQGLASMHGVPFFERSSPRPDDPAQLAAGEALTRKEGGLDCRQCHGLGNQTPLLDNNAQGISFRHMPARLRRGYYDRWMRDPLRIDPLSKMPRFSPDGQTTPVREILGGAAGPQFEALWQYIQAVPGMPLPAAELPPAGEVPATNRP